MCTNTEDRRMIDSGAQCCVCPRDYAPEIELIELSVGQIPNLRTATNAKMHVYGLKYVHYRLSKDTGLNVRYYVCDVPTPILSVSNMVNAGYAVVLDKKPHVKLHGWLACPLHCLNGLHYILPLERSELDRQRRNTPSTTPRRRRRDGEATRRDVLQADPIHPCRLSADLWPPRGRPREGQAKTKQHQPLASDKRHSTIFWLVIHPPPPSPPPPSHTPGG